MAYRLNGTDPFVRFSIGAFNGYAMRGATQSAAMLLRRNATGVWMGGHVIDTGAATDWYFAYEFNPANHLISDTTAGTIAESATALTSTTEFMIVGYRWDGTLGAGGYVWEWKVGAAAWVTEADTAALNNGTAAGSGYRHIIGNIAGLGDDANYDVVCVGMTKTNLSQGTFESLDMTTFDTWRSVFTGSGAWLIGFETIDTQLDRTGNGGDEVSRSGSITLVSDPPGWSWYGATVAVDYSKFPKQKIRESIGVRR